MSEIRFINNEVVLFPGITSTASLNSYFYRMHSSFLPKPAHTGVFVEDADIEAKGTGVKVSADDLDVLLADIEKLTREE